MSRIGRDGKPEEAGDGKAEEAGAAALVAPRTCGGAVLDEEGPLSSSKAKSSQLSSSRAGPAGPEVPPVFVRKETPKLGGTFSQR